MLRKLKPMLLLSWLLFSTTSYSQLHWSAIEQYQPDKQQLHYSGVGNVQGQLLIWPEVSQTHLWLPVAQHWQQLGWEVTLLVPEVEQTSFTAASEQPKPEQSEWLTQQADRLTHAMPSNEAPTSGPTPELPLLVVTQGSAALWYQQLVDSQAIAAPSALILFDALPVQFSEQLMLAISLSRSPYPILDVYSQAESAVVGRNQQRRQQQLKHREKSGYALLQAPSPILLNKLISGWLVRLGWQALPPNAPHYLKEQLNETGISRSQDHGPLR